MDSGSAVMMERLRQSSDPLGQMNPRAGFVKVSFWHLVLGLAGFAAAVPLLPRLASAVPALSVPAYVLGVCWASALCLMGTSLLEAEVSEAVKARRSKRNRPGGSSTGADYFLWFPDRWWLKPLIAIDVLLLLVLNYAWLDVVGSFALFTYAMCGATFLLGVMVHLVDVARGRAEFLIGHPRPRGDPAIWRNPAEEPHEQPSVVS